jgi:hypothetical protein
VVPEIPIHASLNQRNNHAGIGFTDLRSHVTVKIKILYDDPYFIIDPVIASAKIVIFCE